MKKLLAVLISVVMALTCCIPAFAAEKTVSNPASAYAEYDKAKVAQNDADYIASLDYDQMAGLLLDWLDRKIAAVAADLNAGEGEQDTYNIVINYVFENNETNEYGGGFYLNSGTINVNGGKVNGNTSYLDGGGVYIQLSDHCEVNGCTITDIGLTMKSSCGVLVMMGVESKVKHNTVANAYYTGISIGWRWEYYDNCIFTRDSIVRGNHVHGCMRNGEMSDGAGIYILGGAEGTVVEDNAVHDLGSSVEGPLASAIYLDESCTDVTVRHNLCWNSDIGLHVNHGKHNRILGNVFAYNRLQGIHYDNSYEGQSNSKVMAFLSQGNIYIQNQGCFLYNGKEDPNNFKEIPYILSCDFFDNDNESMLAFATYLNQTYTIQNVGFGKVMGCVMVSCASALFHTEGGQYIYNGNIDVFLNGSCPAGSVFGMPIPSSVILFPSPYILNPNAFPIRLYIPSGCSSLCFSLAVWSGTDIKMSTPFKYRSTLEGSDTAATADVYITLNAGILYYFTVYASNTDNNMFTDLIVSNINDLKVFDTTFVGGLSHGLTYNHAEIDHTSIPLLASVRELYVRYSVRNMIDINLGSGGTADPWYADEANFYVFSSLRYLYYGSTDSLSGSSSSMHPVGDMLLPVGLTSLMENVNLSVRRLQPSMANMHLCKQLYLYDLASWVRLLQVSDSFFCFSQLIKFHVRSIDPSDAPPIASVLRHSPLLFEASISAAIHDAVVDEGIGNVTCPIQWV